MIALLKLIPPKDFFYAAAILALIALGVRERFHLLGEGRLREAASVAQASERLQAKAAADIINTNVQHAAEVAKVKADYENARQADAAAHVSDAERLR